MLSDASVALFMIFATFSYRNNMPYVARIQWEMGMAQESCLPPDHSIHCTPNIGLFAHYFVFRILMTWYFVDLLEKIPSSLNFANSWLSGHNVIMVLSTMATVHSVRYAITFRFLKKIFSRWIKCPPFDLPMCTY